MKAKRVIVGKKHNDNNKQGLVQVRLSLKEIRKKDSIFLGKSEDTHIDTDEIMGVSVVKSELNCLKETETPLVEKKSKPKKSGKFRKKSRKVSGPIISPPSYTLTNRKNGKRKR